MSTTTALAVNNAAERPSQAKQAHVYQIDFTAVASGKRIASTKRRVRWRFGFANPAALANGRTGTACRGEEHDITLVWSITSGKRLILADGQEVHYASTRGNKLDFSWTMRGNHVLKIIAHASPPLSATPGFRQYDFYVDGQSFFIFPKVFRLGLAPGAPGASAQRGGSGGYNNSSSNGAGAPRSARPQKSGVAAVETPNNYDEEEAYLREAIKNSLQETGPPLTIPNNNVSAEGQNLLMDFMDDNTTQISAPGQAGAASALPPSTFPPVSYGRAPQQQSYGSHAAYPQTGNYGGAIVPVAPAPQHVVDPWGSQPAAPTYNTSVPPSAPVDSWAAQPAAPAVGFGYHQSSTVPQTHSSTTDPWGAQNAIPMAAPPVSAPASDHWGSHNVSPGPTTSAADPWRAQPAPALQAYAPVQTQGFMPETPATVVDVTNPTPPTPSSIGFASPQGQGHGQSQSFVTTGYQSQHQQQAFAPESSVKQNGVPLSNAQEPSFTSPPPEQDQVGAFDAAPVPEPASSAADPALFTMSGLSGQVSASMGTTDPNASLADQAYAKYANMGEFDLISKNDVVKDNPFETAPASQSVSLQDMKNNVKSEPKKSVMNDPLNPMAGALVVAPTQTGNNWGQQAGLGTSHQPGLATYGQVPSYGQQPSSYGQQPSSYGQQPQSTFGQQMQQPSYGQQQPPAYGQQATSYGQVPPSQQQAPPPQQPSYGQTYGQQPPPLQQPPYGGFGQQQY